MDKPILYSFIDKEQVIEMLEAFHECLDLPIQIIDVEGSILQSCGKLTNFCSLFQKYLPYNETCEKLHISASKKAIDLGESYIFSCHAGLNHIVFPLIHNNVFLGSVLVGPFLMDTPDSTLVQDIAKRYKIPTSALLDIYDETGSIKVVSPKLVTQVSKLLYYLFSNLISDGKHMLILNKEKLHQQAKINESIQNYKYNSVPENNYPFDLEKKLMTKVKTGNMSEAKGVLNELLGYVFFSEGNSLDIIKSRAIELCSLLSRAAIEGGAPTDCILRINNNFLKIISTINDFENICYKLQEIVEAFIESMFHSLPTKNSRLIKKAISYIAKNFSRTLTLEEVAKFIHINPSYFSSIFKQSTGSSFIEYLNMVRIEESKRLLTNTDYSIIDIAIATGFEDQSYFSKIFKRYTGLTPTQYRQ